MKASQVRLEKNNAWARPPEALAPPDIRHLGQSAVQKAMP
jgi:hypothetical protein